MKSVCDSKKDKMEITINDKADEVIKENLQSLLSSYQIGFETSIISSDLKVQSCKLFNRKCMIASKQITSTEIFAFIAVVVFKLLSGRKDNRNC